MEASGSAHTKEKAAKTIAQSFCLVVGASLVAVGILGFIFGGTDFNAGGDIDGEDFIIFEVNGWHNLVHIGTGAFLLLVAPTAATAATGAIVFGLAYAGVTGWGFIDGDDVASIVAVDTADNILHVGLAVLALIAGFTSGGLALSARKEREPGTA